MISEGSVARIPRFISPPSINDDGSELHFLSDKKQVLFHTFLNLNLDFVLYLGGRRTERFLSDLLV